MNNPSVPKQPLFIVATLGIVYGDIGTSPLYAMKTCFHLYGLAINTLNILGIISLIFWSLILVVSIKYICIILKANNHGEGGILSLLTLCCGLGSPQVQRVIMFLGILGTALFFGDGVITPAISVLGALEGINVITAGYSSYIPALAILILSILFMLQKKGSQIIGSLFGPIMLLWFAVLALLGIYQIVHAPEVLKALNPFYGFLFVQANGISSLLTFGAIVLVVTGAEALYADLGHFNERSIQNTWLWFVLPALALNYFGQGALLLHSPTSIENPFYLMAPNWALYPLVMLSTAATIIASQAIISGIFSISWQAIQLDYLPRMTVIHTSSQKIGQVYVPVINYLLLLATVIAVLMFKTSNNLASAYGITITWIMLITSTLACLLAFYGWRWSITKTVLVFTPFFILDGLFFATSSVKMLTGGWFPIMIALFMYLIISSWKTGRETLMHDRNMKDEDLVPYVAKIAQAHAERIPGTAIFMCRSAIKVPHTLKIHLKHNKFLHERVIFLSIVTHHKPKVSPPHRMKIIDIGYNVYQVFVNFGFVEVPDINTILAQISDAGISLADPSFIMSKGLPVASSELYLSGIREMLFIFLSHNAANATEFFDLPFDQVVEYGIKFKI